MSRLVYLLILSWVTASAAFYVPGVEARTFPAWNTRNGSACFKVNSMTSEKNPISYAHFSKANLTCSPAEAAVLPRGDRSLSCILRGSETPNLGEVLWGDIIQLSPYFATMRENITCLPVCEKTYSAKQVAILCERISKGYRVNMILDNLPLVSIDETGMHKGARLGSSIQMSKKGVKRIILNNHMDVFVKFHRPEFEPPESTGYRIVGFLGSSRSVAWTSPSQCQNKSDMIFPGESSDSSKDGIILNCAAPSPIKVTWSYSVGWIDDPRTRWITRWDFYFSASGGSVRTHWLNIVNSLLVSLFLSALVALIILRTLHKDFNRYNDIDNASEGQEETGWKMVHADIFRRPRKVNILASLIGSGVQLNVMFICIMIFAVFGFLSPANRGSMLTVLILLFELLSFIGGYVSALVAKMWHAQSWSTTLQTATLVPGVAFGTYFIVNLFMAYVGSATAIPAGTLFALFSLWLFVSTPLVFCGAVVGYKRPAIEFPVRVNEFPRPIPAVTWFLYHPIVTVVIAGALPFAAGFLEIWFLLNSVWQRQFFYMFAFVFLVYIIMLVVVSEVAIVLIYMQLCLEDYRVWWRSFFFGASTGGYLFVYSATYFFNHLSMSFFWAAIFFFGSMAIVSFLFSVITGTISFVAIFIFTRIIYSSIKVD